MATDVATPYIETLLKRVVARGGNLGVRFETGAPVRVTDGSGAPRDVTTRPLSAQEILSAVAPIVPDDVKPQLHQPEVAFEYVCAGVGAFTVMVRREGEQVSVAIDPAAASTPAAVPATAPVVTTISEPAFVVETTAGQAIVIGATETGAGVGIRPVEGRDSGFVAQDLATLKAEAPVSNTAAVQPKPATTAVAASAGAPPIDRLFHVMFERKASDLHLSVGMPPLIRKDGEITPLEADAPTLDAEAMTALLDPIMPQKNRDEFLDRHDTDFAYEIAGLARFRSNMFLDRKGPGAVFRVIPSKILTAEDLGLSPYILQLCRLSKGLVLVTGPTGSGKSTTLCAMVDYINRNRADHIITIEDPIEFVHENKKCLMNQREVHTHTDGFKDALRAALREDPDIVLVGEMRDLETVAIAIETAETGHLVFGTLHTTTAASTVDRVIDQFPTDRQAQIRIMLSESLKGVIAQTLCKKIGGGRIAALEVLIVTGAVSNLIRESKTFQIPSIMQVGKSIGMVSLNDALMDLVAKKLVAPEEAYLKAVDKNGFEGLLKRGGFDTKFAAATAGPS
jgi:twitching motility protein PilT